MARVIVADRVGPSVVPGLLRRAHTAAGAVLDEARADAADLLEQAQRDADRLIAKARLEAAAQAREASIATMLDASAARDRALGDAQAAVVSLAIAVAEKLLGASIEHDPTLIEGIVRPLLARVRRARRLELQLHPEDARALAPRLETLIGDSGIGCPIRVEVDAALRRGGCVLVSNLGTLDARLETRLDLVARALEPLIDHGTGDGGDTP